MDAVALFDPVSTAENLKLAAKDLGFKVIGVFTQPLEFFKKDYHVDKEKLFKGCDEVIQEETIEKIIEKLSDSKFRVVAAIAGPDNSVELADHAAYSLGLYCNRFDLMAARRDKAIMRKVLKESGLPCPDFAICVSEEEVKEFVRDHSFPLMIKTPKGAMTSQVYKCTDLKNNSYLF